MLNQSWLFSLPVFSLLTTAIFQSQELYSYTFPLMPLLRYLNLQTFLAFLILSQISYPGSRSPREFLYEQRKSDYLNSVMNPFILTGTFNAYIQMNEKCRNSLHVLRADFQIACLWHLSNNTTQVFQMPFTVLVSCHFCLLTIRPQCYRKGC